MEMKVSFENRENVFIIVSVKVEKMNLELKTVESFCHYPIHIPPCVAPVGHSLILWYPPDELLNAGKRFKRVDRRSKYIQNSKIQT